jgi:hypothetical protein
LKTSPTTPYVDKMAFFQSAVQAAGKGKKLPAQTWQR